MCKPESVRWIGYIASVREQLLPSSVINLSRVFVRLKVRRLHVVNTLHTSVTLILENAKTM